MIKKIIEHCLSVVRSRNYYVPDYDVEQKRSPFLGDSIEDLLVHIKDEGIPRYASVVSDISGVNIEYEIKTKRSKEYINRLLLNEIEEEFKTMMYNVLTQLGYTYIRSSLDHPDIENCTKELLVEFYMNKYRLL